MHLKFQFLIGFTFIFLIFSCNNKEETKGYKMINYLKVKEMQDSINPIISEDLYNGWLKYSSFYQKKGKKELVFIGATHGADTSHVQFKIIEELFAISKPEIAFNEGGDWHLKGKLTNRNQAIKRAGEPGLMQYLCDQKHIEMVNGDMEEKEEFQKLFAEFPFDPVYLLLCTERFLNPYHQGAYGKTPIEKAFEGKFMDEEFVNSQVKLNHDQTQFAYLKNLYEKKVGRKLDLNDLEPLWGSYLLDKGELGIIHRRSKVLRDSVLLSKIDAALDRYNSVFVTFGASHLLAIKPALQQIIDKQRNQI